MTKFSSRVRAAPLRDRLRALYAAGETRPSYTVGGYRVSLDPGTGRLYAAALGRYLATVRPDGRLRAGSGALADDLAALTAILERPLRAAITAASLASTVGLEPRCATCERVLSGPDRELGIGKRCFEKGEWEKSEEWKRMKEEGP